MQEFQVYTQRRKWDWAQTLVLSTLYLGWAQKGFQALNLFSFEAWDCIFIF